MRTQENTMRERKMKSPRVVSPLAVRRARRSGKNLLIARLVMADEGGQVLPWVVVMLLTVLGVAALVVDCGRAMVIQRELQNATDAAALAARPTRATRPASNPRTMSIPG